MEKTGIRLTVNGDVRSVRCEPDAPLLDVLRHDLGLAGRARVSSHRAVSAVGGPVTTVEGLADGGGGLHPVQQAFIEEQAAQCGYCTSGMVVATAGLLRECPAPARQ